jgi:hypothetical protein
LRSRHRAGLRSRPTDSSTQSVLTTHIGTPRSALPFSQCRWSQPHFQGNRTKAKVCEYSNGRPARRCPSDCASAIKPSVFDIASPAIGPGSRHPNSVPTSSSSTSAGLRRRSPALRTNERIQTPQPVSCDCEAEGLSSEAGAALYCADTSQLAAGGWSPDFSTSLVSVTVVDPPGVVTVCSLVTVAFSLHPAVPNVITQSRVKAHSARVIRVASLK